VHQHQLAFIASDVGVSARARVEHRAGLHAALAAISERRAAALLVYRLAVLDQGLTGQEAVLALVWGHSGEVLTCVGGRIDPQQLEGEIRAASREAVRSFADLERRLEVARLQARRQRKIARGGYAGGAPAFGYRATAGALEPDPDEQATLTRMSELRGLGASLRQIADILTAEGFRPKRADRWHPESLRRIITRLEGFKAPRRGPN
jgi:DNA invertase Pin-like site-specific DNA recombinase